MESTLVSARISQAKKDSATDVLKTIGSTTSELIKSAFDYVIDAKQLPSAAPITPKAIESFRDFVCESSMDVNWGEDETTDYREIMSRERVRDYESLA